jgi:hypothetical protein
MLEPHRDVRNRGRERAQLGAQLIEAESSRCRRAGQLQHRHGFVLELFA